MNFLLKCKPLHTQHALKEEGKKKEKPITYNDSKEVFHKPYLAKYVLKQ